MSEALRDWLVFILVIGGLGLPLTAGLKPFRPDERVCLGAVAGCLITYLFAWVVYWCDWPTPAFFMLPMAAVALMVLSRQRLAAVFQDREARSLSVAWLLASMWCTGLLLTIRNYSGGEWVGDWVEHYQRARFFLLHLPLDTKFLGLYVVPARPPVANLVAGALMSLTELSFASNQVFLCQLATLAFLPTALISRRFLARNWDSVPLLTLLFLASPLFVQNATFAWTKLPAAFFVISAVYFCLPSDRGRTVLFAIASVTCVTAGVLTHYSAAPYALIIGTLWVVRWVRARRDPAFKRAALVATLVAVSLGSTWFGWALWKYGVTTFMSTAATDRAGLSIAQNATLRFTNFVRMVVPHPMRHSQYEFVQQASAVGWIRDYCFNLYQTNLLFSFGSIGGLLVMALLWRQRRYPSVFWPAFICASLVLNAAAISWYDRWGSVQIGLQPLVLIGLALIAAYWPALGRWRWLLACGLVLDFLLGIALQFGLQHLAFSSLVLAQDRGEAIRLKYGWTLWRNLVAKHVEGLRFIGDDVNSIVGPAALLLVVLAIALNLACKRPISPDPVRRE